MGIFGAAHGWGSQKAPLPKICHTYPKMMKLGTVIPYLRKVPKKIWITWHIPWVLLTSDFFHRRSANFVISRNTDIDTKFLILLTFLESLKIFLIKKSYNLMMSAKIASPSLLKITVFWNKSYDVIIYVHDVISKIISRDSHYFVDEVMWP